MSPHPQLTMPVPPLCCAADSPCSTSAILDVPPLSFSPAHCSFDRRVEVWRELALVLGPGHGACRIGVVADFPGKYGLGRSCGRRRAVAAEGADGAPAASSSANTTCNYTQGKRAGDKACARTGNGRITGPIKAEAAVATAVTAAAAAPTQASFATSFITTSAFPPASAGVRAAAIFVPVSDAAGGAVAPHFGAG